MKTATQRKTGLVIVGSLRTDRGYQETTKTAHDGREDFPLSPVLRGEATRAGKGSNPIGVSPRRLLRRLADLQQDGKRRGVAGLARLGVAEAVRLLHPR